MGSVDAMKLENILNEPQTAVSMLQGLETICATQVDKNIDVLGHAGLLGVVCVPELLDFLRRALDHTRKLWKSSVSSRHCYRGIE